MCGSLSLTSVKENSKWNLPEGNKLYQLLMDRGLFWELWVCDCSRIQSQLLLALGTKFNVIEAFSYPVPQQLET